MVIQTKNGAMITSGYAGKDADLRYVGKDDTPMCLFSVNVGSPDGGKGNFVNCKAWRELALIASRISKYDPIFVSGYFKRENGSDGKVYESLVADYIGNAAWGMDIANADVHAPSQNTDGFAELSQDEEDTLPF